MGLFLGWLQIVAVKINVIIFSASKINRVICPPKGGKIITRLYNMPIVFSAISVSILPSCSLSIRNLQNWRPGKTTVESRRNQLAKSGIVKPMVFHLGTIITENELQIFYSEFLNALFSFQPFLRLILLFNCLVAGLSIGFNFRGIFLRNYSCSLEPNLLYFYTGIFETDFSITVGRRPPQC
jgi:hypothetical protein